MQIIFEIEVALEKQKVAKNSYTNKVISQKFSQFVKGMSYASKQLKRNAYRNLLAEIGI